MTLIARLHPQEPLHITASTAARGAALCGKQPADEWLTIHETAALPDHVAVCSGCLDASRRPATPRATTVTGIGTEVVGRA